MSEVNDINSSLITSNLGLIYTQSGTGKDEVDCTSFETYVWVLTYLNLVVMVVGIIGNCLLIFTLWPTFCTKPTNFLLINLAIYDTTELTFAFINRHLREYLRHDNLFKDVVYPHISVYFSRFDDVAHLGGTWILVMVTMQRFIGACMPLHARPMCTMKKTKIQAAIIFVSCFIFYLPKFTEEYIVWEKTDNETWVAEDAERPYDDNFYYELIYDTIIYYIVQFILPLLALVIMTIKIIIAIASARGKRKDMTSSSQDKDERGITRALVIVVVVFIVCQLAAPMRRAIRLTYPLDPDPECTTFFVYFEQIAYITVTINCAINFYIYVLIGKGFRLNVTRRMLCAKSKKSMDASVVTGVSVISHTTEDIV